MKSSEEFNPTQDLHEDLKDALQGQEFDSDEDANIFAQEFINKRNAKPLDDFHGLSPSAMHRLLYFPFESPDIIRFNFKDAVAGPEDAPMLHLLKLMVDAIGKEGLKPTATGNLPRAVSRDIAKKYLSKERYDFFTSCGDFMSENDVPELNVARCIAELAGFIRMYRGKFTVTTVCRQLVESNAWADIYKKLFMAVVEKFNWAYPSSMIEMPFFQHSFAFTLYLLHKYGNEPRPDEFYAEIFVSAFPMLLEEIQDTEHFSSKKLLKMEYCSQAMDSFGEITGIIFCKHAYPSNTVTALSLLNRLVSFT